MSGHHAAIARALNSEALSVRELSDCIDGLSQAQARYAIKKLLAQGIVVASGVNHLNARCYRLSVAGAWATGNAPWGQP